MKIETKYNIGETVWFEYGGKIYKSPIYGVTYSTSCSYFEDNVPQCIDMEEDYIVCLWVGYSITVNVDDLFPTKEELLKSL